MLDHQEKVEAKQRASSAQPSDALLKIPLIGEVRRPAEPPPKRGRPRTKKHAQLKLGD
jgi:hypothetical protein